ncbi:transglutaminase family protein [Ideonella sp. BN130291]|uniref:transglutaminase family protein n=1 Tax=Ideonella sp. BN130291 TaxID=3112940 RepID=UPI002E2727FD|nr:transglutaminase family protein [Ideonella sp. BN130291]
MVTSAVLQVEHDTHYAYAWPVEQAQHVAFLRPLEDERQQVEAFEMVVEPPPSHHASGRDVFGNQRVLFSVHSPHAALRVAARSRVRLVAPAAFDPAATVAWEAVRDRLVFHAGAPFEPAAEFTAPSPYVPRLAALRELAAEVFTPGRALGEAAIALMQQVHLDFRYETASTAVDTPLQQVLVQRRGVCQDFAHLMIGALRSVGLAARYVSGYLLTTPLPGMAALQGADASHAWVSVYCPGVPGDWFELDPTNNLLPSTEHVRLAVGRDYGDVTPLRGVIRGGGRHTLTVRVNTVRLD